MTTSLVNNSETAAVEATLLENKWTEAARRASAAARRAAGSAGRTVDRFVSAFKLGVERPKTAGKFARSKIAQPSARAGARLGASAGRAKKAIGQTVSDPGFQGLAALVGGSVALGIASKKLEKRRAEERKKKREARALARQAKVNNSEQHRVERQIVTNRLVALHQPIPTINVNPFSGANRLRKKVLKKTKERSQAFGRKVVGQATFAPRMAAKGIRKMF